VFNVACSRALFYFGMFLSFLVFVVEASEEDGSVVKGSRNGCCRERIHRRRRRRWTSMNVMTRRI